MACRAVILLLGLVLLAHSQDIKMLIYNNMGDTAANTATANIQAAADSGFTLQTTVQTGAGFLVDPIPLSFDIVVYITDDATGRLPNIGMQRLEDFANAGKVVLVTGYRGLSFAANSPASNRPYFFPGGPTHQEFYDMDIVDLLGGVAPGRQNSSDANSNIIQPFSTSPYCDPILNRRFGQVIGTPSGASQPGTFDDIDCVVPGRGAYGCLYISDNVLVLGNFPDVDDFFCSAITVRPMANNGLAVFLTGTTYALTEFTSPLYNTMYNNLLDYASELPGVTGVIPGTPAFDEVVYKHVLVLTDDDIRNGGTELDIKAVLSGVKNQEFIPIFDYILGFDAIFEYLNDVGIIPPHYEAVIVYNLFDTFSTGFLFASLESFATSGGVVIWIDTSELVDPFANPGTYEFLGGSNYTIINNAGVTPTIFNPFSSNAACAPAFSGPFGTISGSITQFTSTFAFMDGWNMTGLFIDVTDPAISCLQANSVPFPGAAIAVRPLGDGFIFFIENSDDIDNQYVWGDLTSPYYIMLNNLLAFAVSPAVIAADPHVLTFDQSALELPFDATKKYSFFSSEAIEFRMETYDKLGDSYIRSIGVSLEGHQIFATLDARFNPLIFVDNTPLRVGDTYEFSIGTLRVTKPETSTMSKAMKNMARFMTIQAQIPGQFTLAGGNFARAYGFWNVEIKPTMHSESSGGLLTSHHARSVEVDLTSFEVSSLF